MAGKGKIVKILAVVLAVSLIIPGTVFAGEQEELTHAEKMEKLKEALDQYGADSDAYAEACELYGNGEPYEAHFMVIEGKPAICTEEGLAEGAYCPVCDEVIKEQEVIAMAPHDFHTVITKARPKKDGKIENKCMICGHIESVQEISYPSRITTPQPRYVYTGKAIKPKFTLVFGGDMNIQGCEYKATFKNNTKIGEATITLNLSGLYYEGTLSKTFMIVPPANTFKSLKSASSRSATVTWKRNTLTAGTQIEYAYNKKFRDSKLITIYGNAKTSRVLKRLKAGSTVYVRIRGYKEVRGTTCYSDWSDTKTVIVK